MKYRVFISYATGDESNVKELYDTLSRLEDIDIYIPEWITQDGKSLVHKIKDGLNSSNLAIALITFNSTNTMWLNQEIGYATAKNIPVISVVEKGIDIKGFIEEQQHITFQRGDFKYNIYQIISKMREIFSQSNSSITHFQITCSACNKKYSELLPMQKNIDDAIEQSRKFSYQCKFCSTALHVEPTTLNTQSVS